MNATTLEPADGAPIFHPADEPHHPEGSSTLLGFWIYLMSDCLIFAMLFAAFGVLGASRGAEIRIDNPDCVAVSYPGFWSDLERVTHG